MIYSITAIGFFLLSIYLWREDSKEKMRLAFVLSVSWLILYEGLRWDIGTDFMSYYDAFKYDDNEHMGFIYRFLNNCFRYFTDTYNIFLLFVSLCIYTVVGLLMYRHSPNPMISLCIYYMTMLGIMGANRQLLAMAVTILSLHFVFERRKYLFILTIFVAALFHITALLFIFAYPFFNYQYSKKKALIVVGIAFVIGVLKLINQIPFVEYLALIDGMNSGTDLAGYVESQTSLSVSLFGSFKRLLLVYIALYAKDFIDDEKYNYFLAIYIIGCCVYLVFNGSVLQIMAGRGAMYYSVYECIVIAYIIINYPGSFFEKEILWALLFVLYFFLMWRDMGNYVILTGEDVYNPYKTILFYRPI